LTFDLVLDPPAVEVRPFALAQVVAELPLSPREKELLLEVGKGKTNAAIARTLGISPATVKKHLEHIYQKLGVSGRVAALARALATSASTVIAVFSASALSSGLGDEIEALVG
jgi:DNA-binding CsgD family transcriptional regulator